MSRIQARKYQREPLATESATHRLKIGTQYPVPRRGGGMRMQPVKLPGFVVFFNKRNAARRFIVDVGAMRLLEPTVTGDPWTPYFDSPQDQPFPPCPETIHFHLPGNAASAAGDSWNYGYFSDSYQCWGRDAHGREVRCIGNGVTAKRVEGGRMVTLECVPVGREGAAEADYCPYSVPDAKGASQCTCVCSLRVCAYAVDAAGNQTRISNLGQAASYLFETRSEQASMAIGAVLDSASKRVGGFIGGVRGIMTLRDSAVRMLNPNAPVPVAYVGRVTIALCEDDLIARENEVRPMLTGVTPVGLIEDHSRALEGPDDTYRDDEAAHSADDPGAAVEVAVAPVAAEHDDLPFYLQDEPEEVEATAPHGLDDAPETLLDRLTQYAWHRNKDITVFTETVTPNGKTRRPTEDTIAAGLADLRRRDKTSAWLKGVCERLAASDPVGWDSTIRT